MNTKTEWKASDTTEAKYIGILEFQSDDGEWHNFEILRTRKDSSTPHRLVFGGSCNVGFLESGYIEYESGFESVDEALQELLSELETYYNAGPEYVSRIIFNERM